MTNTAESAHVCAHEDFGAVLDTVMGHDTNWLRSEYEPLFRETPEFDKFVKAIMSNLANPSLSVYETLIGFAQYLLEAGRLMMLREVMDAADTSGDPEDGVMAALLRGAHRMEVARAVRG